MSNSNAHNNGLRGVLEEEGRLDAANSPRSVKIGGTVVGPSLALNSMSRVSPIEAAKIQSRERGAKILRRRLAVLGTAVVAVASTAALVIAGGEDEQKPPVEPVKTTLVIPESGQGVQSLVEAESAPGVSVDWETTQELIEKARELNLREPQVGVPFALVDTPNTPEVSAAPTTTAP